MADPVTPFRAAAGVSFGHQIIDDLGAHTLPTTPANYEIWAAYKNASHPTLSHEIDQRLAAGEALTEDVCSELHELHFAKTRLSAQMLEASAEVAREIADVAVNLRQAGARTGAFAGELQAAATGLEAPLDIDALRATVSSLARATRDMAAHSQALEQQLQASSQQLDGLQTTLQEVRLQAVTDALTGLANRRHFDEALRAACANAEAQGPLCLVLADIDHFKRVNDVWGHQVGDQVIRFVASVIKVHANAGLAARYGGEEFALILPRTALQDGRAIAELVRAAVRAKRLSKRTTSEVIGVVTISLGIAVLRPGENAAELLERADACLYQSKNAGRDRVTCERANAQAA